MKLILILLILSTPVLAKNKYNFGLGLGVSVANNFVGNKANPHFKHGKLGGTFFPAVAFSYKGFAVRGLGGEYSVFGRRSMYDFKFNFRYFGPKYENDHIAKRSPSIFGGASVRAYFFNLRFNTDLSSKSNGAIWDFFAMLPVKVSKKWVILPKVGVEQFSENFANYYYGVNPTEAVEFSAYSFKQETDLVPFASMINLFFPTDWLALRLILTYRNLPADVTASPLINGNDQFSTVFMSIYRF